MTDPAVPTAEAGELPRHAVTILLDFPCADATRLDRLRSLTAAWIDPSGALGLVHPDHRAGEAMEKPLFQPAALELSPDLHPAVRAALAGGAIAAAPTRLPCLSLTQHGSRLLNGDLARPPGDPRGLPGYTTGSGLALPLGPDSRARIAALGTSTAETLPLEPGRPGPDGKPGTPFLRLQIDRLEIVPIRSGTGVVLATLRVVGHGVRLAHLLEALHVLSNAARPDSLGWACETLLTHRFNVRALLDAVLHAARCDSAAWSRLFTYTRAELAHAPPEPAALEVAAWRLSRHYTTAYLPGPDYLNGTALIRPFADVLHAASMEGVATLSVATSTFLQEGFAARVNTVYLPLVTLAFHEHVLLLEMAHRASGDLAEAGTDEALEGRRAVALRRLGDAFLAFRLSYRLPVVSDITMHNGFYAAARAGLELDRITAKLAGDTADAGAALHRVRSHAARVQHLKRERDRAWILGLFAGLLTFLTASAAFREALDMAREALDVSTRHVAEFRWATFLSLLVAIGLAFVSAWLTSTRHRESHAGEEEGDTAAAAELSSDLESEAAHSGSEQITLT